MLILAISGSLRAASYNSAVLRAAEQVMPEVQLFEGLGELPLFNPDRDAAPGGAVDRWRAAVSDADALLIASPEYAHGISGPMKNALDWLVSMPDFPGKPVALWNTSPRAHHAQDALREVLTTMSADLIDLACADIPLAGHPPGPGWHPRPSRPGAPAGRLPRHPPARCRTQKVISAAGGSK